MAMRVLFLTSSRADFGIYEPLIQAMKKDSFFEVSLCAFGTHLSSQHGYTAQYIREKGYTIDFELNTVPEGDSPYQISDSMGQTIQLFAEFWQSHSNDFDWVFCLGDRYEIFAAIMASVPFRIPLAHLHGGETSLGAIDQIFRHSISLASQLHFVATTANKQRLESILGTDSGIHWVGAMALDHLENFDFYSIEEFKEVYQFDFSKKSILVTVHPETSDFSNNSAYAKQLVEAMEALPDYQFLLTMPNADTDGMTIRKVLMEAKTRLANLYLYENLGTRGYFSAMKWSQLLLGNTSSGIIEAASFQKYVINLGDRQLGRQAGENVYHCPFDSKKIIGLVSQLEKKGPWTGGNIYQKNGAAKAIIEILKK